MTDSTLAAIRRKAVTRARRRAAFDATTTELQVLVISAAANGTSEVALAEHAGVTRMTIRSWLGKG